MSKIIRTQGLKSVTTAGTQVPLSATSVGFESLIIQANSSNGGKIYVGNSNVDSTNGIELVALSSIILDGGDLKDVYIDSTVNGEGVKFLYVNV